MSKDHYSMNDKLLIKALSSSGDYYQVHFEIINDRLTVFCNCQAGIHGKLCKHKIGLLAGDFSKLYDQEEKDKLIQVQELVSKTNYYAILRTYNKVKAEVEEAQKKEAKIKAEVESAIKSGLEFVHKS
jgi:hypothetical protein